MSQEIGSVLKDILKEKNITNFQLAKDVGVDRTTFQHFLSGKRKMNLEDLQKIMVALNLTENKKNHLYSLYENEFDDHEVLKNTRDIFSLYAELSNHAGSEKKWIETEEYLVKNKLISDKAQIIRGQVKIEAIIRSCFIEEMGRSEEGHVVISINFKHYFLYELIMRIASGQNKCGKIQNIIPLVNKKKLGNNLDILKTVLMLKSLNKVDYEPYYFYSGTKIYDDISIIVPNYFITSKQVITIDRDFESAIIYEDPEILDYYQKKSQSIISKCATFAEKEQMRFEDYPNLSFEKVKINNESEKFIAFDQLINLADPDLNAEENDIFGSHFSNTEGQKRRSDLHILRADLLANPENLCIRYLVNQEKIEFILANKMSHKIIKLTVKETGIVIAFKEFLNYLPNSVHVCTSDEIKNGLDNFKCIKKNEMHGL